MENEHLPKEGLADEPNPDTLKTLDPRREPLPVPAGTAAVAVESAVGESAFKVVAYYPSWSPEALDRVDFSALTHLIYAFVIPTAEGTLRPLAHPETARELVRRAHRQGVRVSVALGGWSYEDVTLEATFVRATDTAEKREHLMNQLLQLCDEFGFDGVDMDWEYPRVDTGSAVQYEALMLPLSERLHAQGRVLTAAVLSGATPEGLVYYDCSAQTNAVLNAVDWVNIMAYDGGDGDRHSGYDFAVNCAAYWKDLRGLPASKVVLGVPFYARPGWATFRQLTEADPAAQNSDRCQFGGQEVWYNGIPTIQRKARYAREHLGGIMIWEVTQDVADPEKSLLQAIRRTED